MSHTLYDLLWNAHIVADEEGGVALLYIDRQLLHEVSSPQAFAALRERNDRLADRRRILPSRIVPFRRRVGPAALLTHKHMRRSACWQRTAPSSGSTICRLTTGVRASFMLSDPKRGRLRDRILGSDRALSMEARMTLCNMTIAAGARVGLVAPDDTNLAYLKGRPMAPAGSGWDAVLTLWRTLRSDADAHFDLA